LIYPRTMAKYSKATQNLVRQLMRRKKAGKLYSGSGQKVTNDKQAIAIALSEARKKGYKVPKEEDTKDDEEK